MVNPLLYAFTNDHFREAFKCAFRCSPENALVHMQRRRDSEYTSMRHHSHMNGNGALNGTTDPGNSVPLEPKISKLQPKTMEDDNFKVSPQSSPTAVDAEFFEVGTDHENNHVVLLDSATQTDIPYNGVRANKS